MNLAESPLGWMHLAVAAMAMITGSFVLFTPKGTSIHKRIGYFYVVSMLLVCTSALGIYRLTGSFGVFHIAAIAGFVTLAGGLAPVLVKSASATYRATHLWFMYYSVVGLYAAFASELIVRIPDKPFYPMVGIATGATFVAGTVFILRKEKAWTRLFTGTNITRAQ